MVARLALALLLLLAAPARAQIAIEWVEIGQVHAPADVHSFTCCGDMTGEGPFPRVEHVYSITKYEVTNAQYVAFLNAVADADPNGLWNAVMELADVGSGDGPGGIARTGADGSYVYTVTPGRETHPFRFADFHRAARFANWLHNGQPTGAQGAATTETGAYTIGSQATLATWVAHLSTASYWVATHAEWSKAAYWDPATHVWMDWATCLNSPTPVAAAPTATANRANVCNETPGTCAGGGTEENADTTPVGSYTGSPSCWGTFDQLGNVLEFVEYYVDADPAGAGAEDQVAVPGASRGQNPDCDGKATCSADGDAQQASSCRNCGFRVAKQGDPNRGGADWKTTGFTSYRSAAF